MTVSTSRMSEAIGCRTVLRSGIGAPPAPGGTDDTATAERAKWWPDVDEYIGGIIGGRVLAHPSRALKPADLSRKPGKV